MQHSPPHLHVSVRQGLTLYANERLNLLIYSSLPDCDYHDLVRPRHGHETWEAKEMSRRA